MENTTVILIAVAFGLVAARLIKKQREKNQLGGNQPGSLLNKGNRVSSIPDDYEPYSGK